MVIAANPDTTSILEKEYATAVQQGRTFLDFGTDLHYHAGDCPKTEPGNSKQVSPKFPPFIFPLANSAYDVVEPICYART